MDSAIIENNTIESFKLAKNDIITLGMRLAKVQNAQARLEQDIHALNDEPVVARTEQLRHDLDALRERFSKQQLTDIELLSLQQEARQARLARQEISRLAQRHEQLAGLVKQFISVVDERLKAKAAAGLPAKRQNIKLRKEFVASKASLKVHDKRCPFSRNVSRRNKVVFKSRLAAFKKGYKACKCLR